MLVGLSMRSLLSRAALHVQKGLGAFALAVICASCSSGSDYYFVNDIKGEGDTVLFEFLFTCGLINIDWDGSFGSEPNYRIDLTVTHDDQGKDCEEDPRQVPFDVGPMKSAFRAEHPSPTALGLRVPPFEEEQGAICLSNLFQEEPFKGKRCH